MFYLSQSHCHWTLQAFDLEQSTLHVAPCDLGFGSCSASALNGPPKGAGRPDCDRGRHQLDRRRTVLGVLCKRSIKCCTTACSACVFCVDSMTAPRMLAAPNSWIPPSRRSSVRRTRRSLSNPIGSPFALVVVAVALSPPRTFSARLLHNKRRSLFQSVHSRSLAAIYIEHNCLIVEPLSVAIATKQQQQQKIYSSTPSFVRFHFSQ